MRQTLAFAVLSIAIVAPVAAQSAEAGQETQTLSRQQFIADMDAEFARMDANGDGTLTAAEIEQSQRAAAVQEALRQNQAVFTSLDTDGNGALSPQEFAKLANPDAVPVSAAPIVGQFDSNGDEAVSLLEYRIGTQANFDRIDADRDGTVSPAEMGAAGVQPQ